MFSYPRFGIGADEPLGRFLRLTEEEPVPPGECEACVRPREVLPDRNAVEHRELRHCLRMVESQTVRDGGAAVVADDAEPPVPEAAHQLDHVRGHRAL